MTAPAPAFSEVGRDRRARRDRAVVPAPLGGPGGPALPRRGSVIVVVLVTLLLASLMLVKFMESSAVELTLATRQADRERLRADAYSALETALAVMAEIKAIDEDLYAPAQGWGDPYGYAGESPREGLEVEFTFTDESGKRSLPRMSFEEMVELAQALGLGENDARRFSDGLFAWMRADHTPQEIEAEASRYERDTLPHEVPKRSLRSWGELRAVYVARDYVYDEDGALTPFGQALQDNLSLYDFDASNVNALAPAIGTTLGWDETQTASLGSYREGRAARPAGAPPWFRGVDDVTKVLGANVDTEGLGAAVKLVRVAVTVREGAGSFRLEALVGVDKDVKLPAVAAGAGAETPAEPASGETAQDPDNPRSRNPANRRNPNRAGAANAETSPGGGASSAEEKLDYPFGILEVVESAGPPPVAPPDESDLEDEPLS